MDMMDKAAEGRIVRAIEEAIELTNAGAHPNDAITKQAEEKQFGPKIVQRMVEAYNTSRTLAHLKHASGYGRAEDFPLASAKTILARLYPEDVVSPARKAASFEHSDYRYPEEINFMRKGAGTKPPPLTSKKAAPIPRDPAVTAQRNYDIKAGLEKKAESLKSDYRQKHYTLWGHVKAASDYFHKLYREPFAVVEEKVAGEFGVVGRTLMDLVYTQGNLSEKRSALKDIRQLTYDVEMEPYGHIAHAVKAAASVYVAAEVATDAREALETFCEKHALPYEKAAASVEDEVAPALLDGTLGATSRPFEKNALLPMPYMSGPLLLAGGMGALGLEEPDRAASREKADLAVADPIHDSNMRSIKSKAMLSDLISNDPIISSYDPNEVRTAFNQLNQLSPQVAAQPGVVRAMLRRLLQQENVIEPHEAEQLTGVEKNLRQLEKSPAIR
jgi:hypothetical protein